MSQDDTDTTTEQAVTTVAKENAEQGAMGQQYLAAGERVALRRWSEEPGDEKPVASRPYETVGFVIEGSAEVVVGEERTTLRAGDSWLVPADAEHSYRILSPFVAVEATSPPARREGRDDV